MQLAHIMPDATPTRAPVQLLTPIYLHRCRYCLNKAEFYVKSEYNAFFKI